MGKTGIKELLANAKKAKGDTKLAAKPKKAAKPAKEVTSTAVSAQRDKANALSKYTSLLCISMANRLRAVESMVMWVYLIPTEADIIDSMGEVGKQHQKSILAAKSGGDSYEPEAPIHIAAWMAVLECIRDSLTGTPLDDYIDQISDDDYEMAKRDVLYFRKLRCYDKKVSKLLVNLKSGSVAETIWLDVVAPHLKTQYKAEQKYGIAPRSGHERKVLQALKDLGYIKSHETSLTFDGKDEEMGDI